MQWKAQHKKYKGTVWKFASRGYASAKQKCSSKYHSNKEDEQGL